ncbi:hypothetical protein PsorP6_004418 [Peronosclerospora sorghi]|uniref:Uncharacterized protein n=1 Tax=Peronosclerospora sorghi TaxID=230839 RepID=A0ACC0VLA5_9STRA|nr:hypothetical protein PsorP6_004418 [Peronosclerospora sorghi]
MSQCRRERLTGWRNWTSCPSKESEWEYSEERSKLSIVPLLLCVGMRRDFSNRLIDRGVASVKTTAQPAQAPAIMTSTSTTRCTGHMC